MQNNTDSFFMEPLDSRVEARALALEVLCRVLIWMADAQTIEDRGLRASIALYCIRPDLIDGATLEKLGDTAGRTRQWVCKLSEDFCQATGFKL